MGTTFDETLTSSHEEDVQRYLTDHAQLLFLTFGRGIYYKALIPKFRFGNEYVSDFVMVERGSATIGGPWISIMMIELEPPTEKPYTRAGLYSKRLNSAVAQVTDWLSWIRTNDSYFRTSLCQALQSPDTIIGKHFETSELTSLLSRASAGIYIPGGPTPDSSLDSTLWRCIFVLNTKIIIGRRGMFSHDDNRRRASLFAESQQMIEIIPYDRLLDAEDLLARGLPED